MTRRRCRDGALGRGPIRARVGVLCAGLLVPLGTGLRAQTAPPPAPDTVVLRVDGDGAWVEQRIPAVEGTVEAYAIRIGDRPLEVVSVEREGERLLDARLEPRPGAYRFHVRSGAPVRIRYRVRGPGHRIPLFAPAGPGEVTVARGAGRGIVVLVRLPRERAARLHLRTSLPRLRRAEERDGGSAASGGSGDARPPELPGGTPDAGDVVLIGEAPATPSFVHLRASGRVPRLADALSVVVILLGAAWAWRKGRRESGGPARRDAAGPADRPPAREAPRSGG